MKLSISERIVKDNELEKLLKINSKIKKKIKIDLSVHNLIKINCKYCLFPCCDLYPKNYSIPLTITEKRKFGIENIKTSFSVIPDVKILLQLKYSNISKIYSPCMFFKKNKCGLSDSNKPLACKIYPYDILKNKIVFNKHCICIQNMSFGDIQKGAEIVKNLLINADIEFLKECTKITIQENNYINLNTYL
jgi:hypothetical protein